MLNPMQVKVRMSGSGPVLNHQLVILTLELCEGAGTTSIFQMGKFSLKVLLGLVQGHTVRDSTPRGSADEFIWAASLLLGLGLPGDTDGHHCPLE